MLKQHVCKYCNKSFPCSSSLGGHMRSHIENSGFDFDDSGFDLARTPEKERICKECGKGFQSMKALCGHMACHSERGKVVANNNVVKDLHHDSWEIANQKSETGSHSDTETGFPRRQRRSKRLRYKKNLVVTENDCVSVANNHHNNHNGNGSSSVSGIEYQELEEVAMCLLMLSRDCGNWDGLNYVAESSDIGYFDYFDNRSRWEGQNYVHFKNSDSEYFRNETRKIESDVCVNGYFRNAELKSEKNGSRLDVEMDKGVKRFKKGANFESIKGLIYDDEDDDEEDDEEENDDYYEHKKAKKRSKFECFICSKILSSPQALGGHIASHKKNNNNGGLIAPASTHESGENSLETDNIMSHFYQKTDYKYDEKASVYKNGKKHECPFCFKVFKSGQALGGHKRIHNVGGSEERNNRNPVANQELDHQVHDLLDLNWPPPMKD